MPSEQTDTTPSECYQRKSYQETNEVGAATEEMSKWPEDELEASDLDPPRLVTSARQIPQELQAVATQIENRGSNVVQDYNDFLHSRGPYKLKLAATFGAWPTWPSRLQPPADLLEHALPDGEQIDGLQNQERDQVWLVHRSIAALRAVQMRLADPTMTRLSPSQFRKAVNTLTEAERRPHGFLDWENPRPATEEELAERLGQVIPRHLLRIRDNISDDDGPDEEEDFHSVPPSITNISEIPIHQVGRALLMQARGINPIDDYNSFLAGSSPYAYLPGVQFGDWLQLPSRTQPPACLLAQSFARFANHRFDIVRVEVEVVRPVIEALRQAQARTGPSTARQWQLAVRALNLVETRPNSFLDLLLPPPRDDEELRERLAAVIMRHREGMVDEDEDEDETTDSEDSDDGGDSDSDIEDVPDNDDEDGLDAGVQDDSSNSHDFSDLASAGFSNGSDDFESDFSDYSSEDDHDNPLDLSSFPTRTITADDGESSCPICHEDVAIDTVVTVLHDDHWFHTECLRPWRRRHQTCPLCRLGVD